MNKQLIHSWTEEDLIGNVHHRLRQKTAAAKGYVELLTNEEYYGYTTEEQKQVLYRLRSEIDAICVVTQWMAEWISIKKDTSAPWFKLDQY
jgi:hypothetical protein